MIDLTKVRWLGANGIARGESPDELTPEQDLRMSLTWPHEATVTGYPERDGLSGPGVSDPSILYLTVIPEEDEVLIYEDGTVYKFSLLEFADSIAWFYRRNDTGLVGADGANVLRAFQAELRRVADHIDTFIEPGA